MQNCVLLFSSSETAFRSLKRPLLPHSVFLELYHTKSLKRTFDFIFIIFEHIVKSKHDCQHCLCKTAVLLFSCSAYRLLKSPIFSEFSHKKSPEIVFTVIFIVLNTLWRQNMFENSVSDKRQFFCFHALNQLFMRENGLFFQMVCGLSYLTRNNLKQRLPSNLSCLNKLWTHSVFKHCFWKPAGLLISCSETTFGMLKRLVDSCRLNSHTKGNLKRRLPSNLSYFNRLWSQNMLVNIFLDKLQYCCFYALKQLFMHWKGLFCHKMCSLNDITQSQLKQLLASYFSYLNTLWIKNMLVHIVFEQRHSCCFHCLKERLACWKGDFCKVFTEFPPIQSLETAFLFIFVIFEHFLKSNHICKCNSH